MFKLFLQTILEILIPTFEPNEIHFYQQALPYQDMFGVQLGRTEVTADSLQKEGYTLRLLEALHSSAKQETGKKLNIAYNTWLNELSLMIERMKALDRHFNTLEGKKSAWLQSLYQGVDPQSIHQQITLCTTEIEKLLVAEDRETIGLYPLLKKAESTIKQNGKNKNESEKLTMLLASYPPRKLLDEVKTTLESIHATIDATVQLHTAQSTRATHMSQLTAQVQTLQATLQSLTTSHSGELKHSVAVTQALLDAKEKQLLQNNTLLQQMQQAAEDKQHHSHLLLTHLRRENDQLNQQVLQLRDELAKALAQGEDARQKLTASESQNQETTVALERESALTKALNQRVATFQTQIKSLETQKAEQFAVIQKSEQTSTELTRQLDSVMKERDLLLTQKQNDENERARLHQRISKLEQSEHALQASLAKQSAENTQLMTVKDQLIQVKLDIENTAAEQMLELELQLMAQKCKTSEILRNAFCMDFAKKSESFQARKTEFTIHFAKEIKNTSSDKEGAKPQTPERVMPSGQRKVLCDSMLAVAAEDEKKGELTKALSNYMHAYQHASSETTKDRRISMIFSASKQKSQKETVKSQILTLFKQYKDEHGLEDVASTIDLLTELPSDIDVFFELDLEPEDIFELFGSLLTTLETAKDETPYHRAKKYYYWVIDTIMPYYIDDLQDLPSYESAKTAFKESGMISDYIMKLDTLFSQQQMHTKKLTKKKSLAMTQTAKTAGAALRKPENNHSDLSTSEPPVGRKIDFMEDATPGKGTTMPAVAAALPPAPGPTFAPIPANLPPPSTQASSVAALPPPPTTMGILSIPAPMQPFAPPPMITAMPPAPTMPPHIYPPAGTALPASASGNATSHTPSLPPPEVTLPGPLKAKNDAGATEDQTEENDTAAEAENSVLASIKAKARAMANRTTAVSPSKTKKTVQKSGFVSAFESRLTLAADALAARRAAMAGNDSDSDSNDGGWREEESTTPAHPPVIAAPSTRLPTASRGAK